MTASLSSNLPRWPFRLLLVAILLTLHLPLLASGSSDVAGHVDPVAIVILEILLVILVARIGGHYAEQLGQPPVLGELLTGILIGSLTLLPVPGFVPEQFITDARTAGSHMDVLGRIGVILLLFGVGLETRLSDMMKVGWTSLLVAVVGVIFPFGLGWAMSTFFISDFPEGVNPLHAHIFLGATLSATSVGITARVLQDLKEVDRRESRIVLSAAVIDDVLGLIVLAVVGGIVTGGSATTGVEVLKLAGTVSIKAILFLGISIFLGLKLLPPVFRFFARFRNGRLVLSASLGFCFLMSFIANQVELATIVGAFAAGLILEERHLRYFTFDEKYNDPVEALHHLIHPLLILFVPIFFVQMGMQVRLETFADPQVLLLAAGLTAAAIVGKLACALVSGGSFWSRMTVGIGMIPRGEVGLIFANIGLALGVLAPGTFSALVLMVVLTTCTTPLLLKLSLSFLRREEAAAGGASPQGEEVNAG